ncbi:unnamed protein product [Prorocentrum cordatum]|uniref:Uncharacterized protein n=1 Tax=Prorocentrum cordatum TaxID=2364126 RepID=A0ABN9X2C7_9DINO|nr:unnamed protein product [Polarella glacialis]
MDSEIHAAKHLGFGDRERRFDAASKFGGRGGHTLSIARPRAHVPEPCRDVCACGPGLALDLHGAAALRRAAELEASGVVKSVARSADCPDVVVTTYLAPEGGQELAVSCLRAGANSRRYARGFDLVHMGCSRCGKNRGTCSGWKGRTKVRRQRLRRQFAAAFDAEGAEATHGDVDRGAGPGDPAEAIDFAEIWSAEVRRAAVCPQPAGKEQSVRVADASVVAAQMPALHREDSWVVVDVPQVLIV